MDNLLTQTLADPLRLQTLRAMAIFDTPSEAAFDRLTRVASKLAHAPVALVSLVDDKRQWFKSFVGLPEPWASRRETPLTHSFCQHVVATNKPLIVEDAREIDFLKDNLAIPDLNVIGYLGIPLTTRDGFGLGSFCVIDGAPRKWTEEEIDIMQDLADTTMSIIDMRGQLVSLHYMAQEKMDQNAAHLAASERKAGDFATMYRNALEELEKQLADKRAPEDILSYVKALPRDVAASSAAPLKN